MIIKSAKFLMSKSNPEDGPKDGLPEYAFIGRSNVGKSSLINMLTNIKGLALTSSTPGKTLLINHFIINDEWYLVDLPGYGYAKRSKDTQNQIGDIIEAYITKRETLINLFVLIDSRLEPQKIDLEFIQTLGEEGVPFCIVFTKMDKLTYQKSLTNVENYKKRLLEEWDELPPIFKTSSEKKQGRDELLDYIDTINQSL